MLLGFSACMHVCTASLCCDGLMHFKESQKEAPEQGIEPWSLPWQGRILTTILPRMNTKKRYQQYDHMIKIVPLYCMKRINNNYVIILLCTYTSKHRSSMTHAHIRLPEGLEIFAEHAATTDKKLKGCATMCCLSLVLVSCVKRLTEHREETVPTIWSYGSCIMQ
jgi:hypothetical protein